MENSITNPPNSDKLENTKTQDSRETEMLGIPREDFFCVKGRQPQAYFVYSKADAMQTQEKETGEG